MDVQTKQQRIAQLARRMHYVRTFNKQRVCDSIANPSAEEPYALMALVRVCGGFGWATARFYPEVEN
jgi:hypothetical protein